MLYTKFSAPLLNVLPAGFYRAVIFIPIFFVGKDIGKSIKRFAGFNRLPLGLSYVKKVIRAHGGTIVVRNNEPYGCIFIITLPHETA